MKKSVLLSILICSCLLCLRTNAQYTLQTALNTQFDTYISCCSWTAVPLPPLSATVPAGPYYGCMNSSTRPMWYYVPGCISSDYTAVNSHLSLFPVFTSLESSVALWGPFDNFQNITLADLDSSKLIACDNFTDQSGQFGSYLPAHLDSGKVYIYLFTTSDTVQNQSLHCGTLVDVNDIYLPLTCQLCNGQATYWQEFDDICVLSVDTPSNHISLTWEKHASDIGIAGYVIQRKNVFGTYDSIAYVPYNSFSVYVDTAVNAAQQKRYYKVYPIDSCGQTFSLYNYGHEFSQIFLQSYPGLNNVVNLTWDYNYFQISNGINVFYVWRSSNYAPFQLIDSLPITGGIPNTSQYTDVNTPAGAATYFIEVRQSTPCYPSFTGTYGASLSNPSGVMVLGVNELNDFSFIKLLPNPAKNSVVKFDFGNAIKQPLHVTLSSSDGTAVDDFIIEKGNATYNYNKQNLAAGVYFVRLSSNEIVKTLKLVNY